MACNQLADITEGEPSNSLYGELGIGNLVSRGDNLPTVKLYSDTW